ncbi:unnamed protein product [Pocillopora meandrina]|uniref:Death domain-containing protein n=1 Tax=Pocillopora meandrina TaxID=46732 RepID=A0AAU9Y567_9CNID|nr:unnamed protein product [Pocillopora meandrina]
MGDTYFSPVKEDKRKKDKHTGNTTGPDKTDSSQTHYSDCGPTRSTERPDQAALPRTSTTEMESENGVPQSGRNPSWSPSETGGGIEEIHKENADDNELNRDQPKVALTGQSFKVEHIPYKVLSEICLELNIKDEYLFNDFRMLAEKMGFGRALIQNLGQSQNPTDELLKQWSSKQEATVGKLIEFLTEMKKDVAAACLKDWLKEQVSNK